MAHCNSRKEDISDSLKKLVVDQDREKDFESPFKWHIPEQTEYQSKWMITKVAEKINNAVDDKNVFKWFRYTKLLVLIYEHTIREEPNEALRYVKMCEDVLAEPEEQNMSDGFFTSIQKALFHVFLATKLWLIEHKIIDEDCMKLAKEITSLNEMNNEEKAGVKGIKTAVFMSYGPQIGSRMLKTIREAIMISPNQAEWYYREGLILKRQRKTTDTFSIDRSQIFKAFEKAYELNPQNASCVLKYASELKHVGFHMDPNLDTNVYHKHWNEVVCLYNKALELRPECPYMLTLVAKGFKSFPKEYCDYDKMKKLLLKARERAPNHYLLLHDLGWLYKSVYGDWEEACKCFKQAFDEGSYGAAYSYVKTKLRSDPQFDPIPILKKVKDNFFEENRKAESIIHMGCYYLLVKDDIDSALKQFSEVLEFYPHSNFLKEVKPSCINIAGTCSILELLHNILNEKYIKAPMREKILKRVYEIEPNLEKEPTCSGYWTGVKWCHIRIRNNSLQGQHNVTRAVQGISSSRDLNWRDARNTQDEKNSSGHCRTNDRSNNTFDGIHDRKNQRSRNYNGWNSRWNSNENQNPVNYGANQRNQRPNRNFDRNQWRYDENQGQRNWRNTSPPPEGSWRR